MKSKKNRERKCIYVHDRRTKKLDTRGRPNSWMGGPQSYCAARREQAKRRKVGINHVLVKVTKKGTGEILYWLGKEALVSSLRERYNVEIKK